MHLAARLVLSLALLLSPTLSAFAQPEVLWQRYTNHQYGYSVDIPFGLFASGVGGRRSNGITLSATSGGGELQIYGGSNAQHADPAAMARLLAGAEQVKQVTYRAGGRNWLVLSGFYRPVQAGGADLPGFYRPLQAGDADRVIFYTKLMFSPDGSSISAFEISYPAIEKLKYDPIIAHLEKTLTPPR